MAVKKKDTAKPGRLLMEGTGQSEMFEKSYEQEVEENRNKKVECLGLTFDNDEARRQYFLEKLREHLKDPEFRKIEGFPIGTDEDILALSDPPYYTACPNPFIADFIKHYGKPYDPNVPYSREPFAADVSEGKNDPIYNAHSYHTKVPHKAIMRYILHYTEPGDVVLDGFCGTGMTGVAAQLCGDGQTVASLDYNILSDGVIMDHDDEIGTLGQRYALLSDLSPLATFVASNYSDFSCIAVFAGEALQLINKIEKDLAWLYESTDGGKVLSAVWSDVFLCPNCSHEVVFWDTAIIDGKILESFPCPHCSAIVGKAASKATGSVKLERSFDTTYEPVLKKVVRGPKSVLVEETVRVGSSRKTKPVLDEKRSNFFDSRFQGHSWPVIPVDEFFPGRQTNKLINGSGISHICRMYTQRALFAYGYLWQQALSTQRYSSLFKFCLSSINNYISKKQGYFGGGGGVSGTLFTPSLHLERNIFDVLRRKIQKLLTRQLNRTTYAA